MFYYIFLPFTFVGAFINQGGYVLIVLFIVALYMWFLISERVYFYKFEMKDLIDNSYKSFLKMKGHNDWINSKYKRMHIAEINLLKNKNIKATNAKIVWANHPSRINQNNMCICTLCNSPTPEGEIKRWGKCSFCWRKIKN